MPNKWIEFVREWAVRNNTTYSCAISKPECSAEYRKKKAKEMRSAKIDKMTPKQREDFIAEYRRKHGDERVAPPAAAAAAAPKVVIATFQNAYNDKWVITDDGEVLELAKSKRFIVIKNKGSVKDAFDWLMKYTKKDLFLTNYTYNQTTYKKRDADDLKQYGLSLKVPSPNILKIFYADWFNDKDAYAKMIYDEAAAAPAPPAPPAAAVAKKAPAAAYIPTAEEKAAEKNYPILIDTKVNNMKKFLKKIEQENNNFLGLFPLFSNKKEKKKFDTSKKKLKEELDKLNKEGRDQNGNLYVKEAVGWGRAKYGEKWHVSHPTAYKDPYYNAEKKLIDPLYEKAKEILDTFGEQPAPPDPPPAAAAAKKAPPAAKKAPAPPPPPPAKQLSSADEKILNRAKQQLSQMDRARSMGMMMDEDQRDEIEDTIRRLSKK